MSSRFLLTQMSVSLHLCSDSSSQLIYQPPEKLLFDNVSVVLFQTSVAQESTKD